MEGAAGLDQGRNVAFWQTAGKSKHVRPLCWLPAHHAGADQMGVLPSLRAALRSDKRPHIRDGVSRVGPNQAAASSDVRFSNRPTEVKALSDYPPARCRCRSRARASLRTRHHGPSIMGFEDQVEQSLPRPCRKMNGRPKRTYELTSSIVPRGTSFHRWQAACGRAAPRPVPCPTRIRCRPRRARTIARQPSAR